MDDRTNSSLTGTEFIARLGTTVGTARENLIDQAVALGQYPSFLTARLVDVPISSGAVRGTLHVAPDFFGIGTNDDWIRMPMYPGTAQKVVERLGMRLPTRKMADAIHAAARRVRMPYIASNKESNAAYVSANNTITSRVASILQGALIDGQKKYILASDANHPSSVIIYGADNPDTGNYPLQPYSWVHADTYVDYSHGVRLIAPTMTIEGRGEMPISAVMSDPSLAPLVSSGPFDRNTRYRT